VKKEFVLSFVFVLLAASFAMAANAPITFTDVKAKNGMVAAANGLASKAGVEILRKGGNAVDAAVATALALNVVEPNASGLGGGGFATIRLKDGQIVCWDFREMAPASATKDLFSSEQAEKEKWSELGGKAVGVPGSPMGLFTILRNHGTMSFAEVAAPAIALAENGFTVDPLLASIVKDEFEKISTYNPDGTVYTPNGLPIEEGATLKNPKLAETFRLLAEKGVDAYYNGPVAEAIVAAVNKAGGKMTVGDLANYKIEKREPLTGTYRGYTIVAPPPASSAGAHVIQILNIMENFPVKEWGHNSEKFLHALAETSKMMFADRSKFMADTAFVKVPLRGLTSKAYAKLLADSIEEKARVEITAGDPFAYDTAADYYTPAGEHNAHQSTTHFSVIDKDGNMVACTWTINYFFGGGVFVPEYGFMLNNEMDDFSSNAASVNAPEPGKRPLSSMSPTIVMTPEGKPFAALGAAGGTRIMMGVAQVIMNIVDFGMKMSEAIEQPRLIAWQSGGKAADLRLCPRVSPQIVRAMEARGYTMNLANNASCNGILFNTETGELNGAADSRVVGAAAGY